MVACELVGSFPAVFTAEDVATWYPTLAKPWFTPPSRVFGPVWTVLFALLGTAAYLVWRDGEGRARTVALGIVVGQFALDVAWTFAFFGTRSPGLGLAVIAALWVALVATVFAFDRVRRTAALLLVPYLAWVSFATLLNLQLWRLN